MGIIARSAAVIGVEALAVEVQVDARLGTFNFQVVGLPDGAIREARDRVISAIRAAGYFLPDRHITVNLAPSDLRKEGSGYDLPIAVGVLTASRLVPETDAINDFVIIGELSLDGGVRPVRGVLAVALAARAWGMKGVIVPEANAQEAAFVQGIDVIGVTDLPQIVQFLRGELDIAPTRVDPQSVLADNHDASELDYAQVVGQEHAKRAMEIAAAGGHNVLLAGPPGGGKTMLARRLTTILPPMSLDEALEVTKIHSIAGRLPDKAAVISRRPFESPHHTISDAGLAGGGAIPRPGTISLAHNGVLFLDELPEFSRHVLETLRQPLEEGDVTVVRAAADCTFPARFSMVAAMNPCPCGYYGDSMHECRCAPGAVARYIQRISGPLLDRIDLHVEVPSVRYKEIANPAAAESSEAIRARVVAARNIQIERFAGTRARCNAAMSVTQIRRYCRIDADGHRIMEAVMERLGLSARAHDRILKVSRTIADLDGVPDIRATHIAEAVQYRGLDRTFTNAAA